MTAAPGSDQVPGNAPGNPSGEGPDGSSSAARGGKRSAARLGAIQALYQIEITGAATERVVQEFLSHRLDEEVEGLRLGAIDDALFTDLVGGVVGEAAQLDDMLSAVLAEGWPIERLEALLKLILRAGAYELAYRRDVPARSIIKEYVDLAHAFLSGKEPGMANGVLDRLARDLRPEEFEAASPQEPGA